MENAAQTPLVTTDSEGGSFQRTPFDEGYAVYHTPENFVSYNMTYLKSDEKGCYACHDDLAETLNNMEYDHADLSNSYGILPTVQMCLDCHSYSPGYVTEADGFGVLIHGIHNGTDAFEAKGGTCDSCHLATNDGNGMQLWDVVKYNWLRGIAAVDTVEGDFSFQQDDAISQDEVFDFDWLYYDNDYIRHDNAASGAATDTSSYDDWTITVEGAVSKETTYTLSDLIAQAPSEDVTLKMQCTLNPTGGPLIANAKVKGVPLSWLTSQAGVSASAYEIMAVSSDGFAEPILMSNLEGHEAYIIYEIDGNTLRWEDGFPVSLWVGGSGAAASCVKELSSLVVYDSTTTDATLLGHQYCGWLTEQGWTDDANGNAQVQGDYYNKPNVGIFNNREGRILAAGKAYTFEGYADSWESSITAIEFSLDGENWTSYATTGATSDRWVHWSFSYTPTDAGAYVLRVRSVNEDGLTTPEPIELMFNVES